MAAAVPDDVFGLRTFRALGDLELHQLTLAERTVAVLLDLGIVNENVTASLILENETVAFVLIEPFYFASLTQIQAPLSSIKNHPVRERKSGIPFNRTPVNSTAERDTPKMMFHYITPL